MPSSPCASAAARARRACSRSSDLRLNKPRIEPVDLDRLEPDQRAALAPLLDTDGGRVGGGRVLNIFRTLAHAPKALTAFIGWGSYILSKRSALRSEEQQSELQYLMRISYAVLCLQKKQINTSTQKTST